MSRAVTSFWKSTKALPSFSSASGATRPSVPPPTASAPSARGASALRRPAARAVGERLAEIEHAGAGADADHVLRRRARQERARRGVERELAARLREQMHARRPAAGHGDEVAVDVVRLARPPVRPQPRHAGVGDPEAAARAEDRRVHLDRQPARAGGRDQAPSRLGAAVDDHGDLAAGVGEIERGAIAAVVRGGDDDAVSRLDAVAGGERAGGVGEHDARPVVVGKHQRALVRAGGDDHPLGPHLPEAGARQPDRDRRGDR